jgi:catechol-2,3-dioxygenase
MWIDSLELRTHQLAAMLDFYSQTLELPVLEQTQDQFTVQAGDTTVTFVQSNEPALPCHYAFNVPEGSFADSKQWLESRIPLLTDADGQDEFHSQGWNADMVYYSDPDGNIGELVARHTLPESYQTRSTSNPILNVSEIGIAVEDVPAFVTELESVAGLLPYSQSTDATFTPVGDEYGLFIVVKRERLWFPNRVLPAHAVPLTVRFRVGSDGEATKFELSGQPYKLRAFLVNRSRRK